MAWSIATDFFAVLGSVIERGEHHHRAFEVFRPGINLAQERLLRWPQRRVSFGRTLSGCGTVPTRITGARLSHWSGWQPFADFVEELGQDKYSLDFVGSSEQWGVDKPSPDFFARIVRLAGVLPGEIAYVGDRLDNDVLPAKAAGMVSVFLPRGPWALIHGRRPAASEAHRFAGSRAKRVRELARTENRSPGVMDNNEFASGYLIFQRSYSRS